MQDRSSKKSQRDYGYGFDAFWGSAPPSNTFRGHFYSKLRLYHRVSLQSPKYFNPKRISRHRPGLNNSD